jgi:Uma2 family endonuclease
MAITRRLTLAEFLELPEEKPPLELRNGMVSPKVSPQFPHGALQFRFGRWLESAGGSGRQLQAFTEVRLNLRGESYVPDLVAFREDRVPSTDDGEFPEYAYEPPDIVVEIASPGQTLGLLIGRCRHLVGLGVPVVVLLVPYPRSRRTVYVFRPGAEVQPLTGADVVDLGDVVRGLQGTVDGVFALLRARPA